MPLLALSSTTAFKNATAACMGPRYRVSRAVGAEPAAETLKQVTVTGFEAKRSLRAVRPKDRRPTGPARTLYGVAYRAGAGGRSPDACHRS